MAVNTQQAAPVEKNRNRCHFQMDELSLEWWKVQNQTSFKLQRTARGHLDSFMVTWCFKIQWLDYVPSCYCEIRTHGCGSVVQNSGCWCSHLNTTPSYQHLLNWLGNWRGGTYSIDCQDVIKSPLNLLRDWIIQEVDLNGPERQGKLQLTFEYLEGS